MSDQPFLGKIYSAFFEQEFPLDLTLVVVWIVASILAMYLPILNETPIRIVLALPIVLFIPGYCIIAAFFPKEGDIGISERITLSIGLSIAIIPLIGLGLNFTPWGIRLDSVLISLTVFTWVLVLVAHYRRAILPFEERFGIPFSEIMVTIREGFFPTGSSRMDRLLNIILILVILIAIITTIYVIASPKESEHFSEFFILDENQMAADYPDLINAGQNYPIYIGVGNREYKNMIYTIETWTMFMEFDNVTNTSTILTMDLLDRQSLVLSHNETGLIPYNLSLNKTGYYRVEFLLFNETMPGLDVQGSDRINASYRDLNLWITVR